MLQDYLGAAWEFLGVMECQLGENYLSYDTIESFPLQQLRNSTNLNNYHPKSAKINMN